MTIKIEELHSLADVTNTELDAVQGGFAAAIVVATRNPILAARASAVVLNKFASDPSVISGLRGIGLSPALIAVGTGLAVTVGRGRYTPAATAASLEG